MKKIEIAGKIVEIFESIEEMPIVRFHKFNKMMLVDAAIGSDLTDVDQHIEKIIRYYRTGKPDLGQTELNNLRQNLYFIQSNLSPKFLAFAALVKSINGYDRNDLSDDGLQSVIKELENAKPKDITAPLEAVKKKIDEELLIYFPQLFDNSETKEYYVDLKRRTLAILDGIVNGLTELKRKEIESMTDDLITFFKPYNFTGPKSLEITYDKQFEKMCLLISKELHTAPKDYSVMEFYNAYEFIKESAKEAAKRNKLK